MTTTTTTTTTTTVETTAKTLTCGKQSNSTHANIVLWFKPYFCTSFLRTAVFGKRSSSTVSTAFAGFQSSSVTQVLPLPAMMLLWKLVTVAWNHAEHWNFLIISAKIPWTLGDIDFGVSPSKWEWKMKAIQLGCYLWILTFVRLYSVAHKVVSWRNTLVLALRICLNMTWQWVHCTLIFGLEQGLRTTAAVTIIINVGVR